MVPYNIVVFAAAIGVLPVAAWLWIISQYSRSHARGTRFLMHVFFFGVLSAIPASLIEIVLIETDSNNQILQAMSSIWAYQGVGAILPSVISAGLVALIEEGSKGIGVVLAVFSKRFRIHNDGLIFGMLVGLAFAVTENGVYFATPLSTQAITDISSMVILRFLLSTTAHVIYTGLMGSYLAEAVLDPQRSHKIIGFAKAFGIPIAIHLVFNLLLSTSFSWLIVIIICCGLYYMWSRYQLFRDEAEQLPDPVHMPVLGISDQSNQPPE